MQPSLIALCAFIVIGSIYAYSAIGRSRTRVYTGVCLALLIAIAGLTGYSFLVKIEHALALAARV